MKKLTLFLLTLLFSGFAFAQEDPLLLQYRQKALEYQQQIKIAERQLSSATSKVEAAKSGQLPSLDFNSDYTYYGVPLQLAPPADAPPGTPGEELDNVYSLNLDLYQPILKGGQLKHEKLSAMSEVEMMKSYVGMSKQQVVLNSDMLYWNAVSKKETYNLYMKYKEVIGEFVKVIKDRVEEEVAGKNELYQAMVRYNDAEYKTIRSQKEYMVSIMNLNKIIGEPVNNPTSVADSLIAVQWVKTNDDLSELALNQRPELNYYKNEIEKSTYDEKLAIAKYNPQFGVFAGGKWGSPAPGLQKDPDFNYKLGARLSIPILRWGEKKERQFTAHQQVQIANLKLEETRDRVKMEVESSYYKLERSQEQLNFAKNSLANAAKNVSVMMDRYKEGLSSVLEVLDAQLDWQKTYYNYILAKYDLNVAYSQYQYAVGNFVQP
ncbi:MAG: TolC family protein [Chlorobi bacterium]|nr:TolC family protein [Chlorobiota bacterium]